ncbi:hypothetical protein AHAS_Ahas11G0095100 [Arachis hypogaea]
MWQRLTSMGCIRMELEHQNFWATWLDAYNYAGKMRQSRIANGDTNATLVYLEGKAAADPMYVVRYNLTKDERLGNMIWANGHSRQYIVCVRYAEKNMTSNVKDKRLRSLFKCWLYMDMEVHEFEDDWAQVIEEYRLHESNWGRHMHKKQKLWKNTSIETAAGRFYTQKLFSDVRKEIKGAGAINLVTKKRIFARKYLKDWSFDDGERMPNMLTNLSRSGMIQPKEAFWFDMGHSTQSLSGFFT